MDDWEVKIKITYFLLIWKPSVYFSASISKAWTLPPSKNAIEAPNKSVDNSKIVIFDSLKLWCISKLSVVLWSYWPSGKQSYLWFLGFIKLILKGYLVTFHIKMCTWYLFFYVHKMLIKINTLIKWVNSLSQRWVVRS